jgi:hypothetical protein
MDTDFRLKRHSELWGEQNKRVKRTVIAGLFFGILLLINVLRPYSFDIDKRIYIKDEIEKFKKEKENVENSLKALSDFDQTLESVQETIRKQPWMKEKDKLIQTLAEINRRGEGGWARYQREADDTVRTIGAQVNDIVVRPLKQFLKDFPSAGELMPELSTELETFPKSIDAWIRQNLGKRWYRTLDSKRRRVESLTISLQVKLDSIYSKIKLEKPNLTRKREELSEKIIRLENDPEIKEKEKLLKELEARMEKILPEWIRGMISVQQMIQLYPFIILGLVIYALGIAVSLTTHYQFMANMGGFTQAAKTDPIFSSIWTLTYRGRFGTILTIATYLAFVSTMWILFEMGSEIFAKWLSTEGGGFLNVKSLKVICWFGRCILVIIVCFIVVGPFYRKNRLLSRVTSRK